MNNTFNLKEIYETGEIFAKRMDMESGSYEHIRHLATGLFEEAGEIMGLFKRLDIRNELNTTDLAIECADAMHYLLLFCKAGGLQVITDDLDGQKEIIKSHYKYGDSARTALKLEPGSYKEMWHHAAALSVNASRFIETVFHGNPVNTIIGNFGARASFSSLLLLCESASVDIFQASRDKQAIIRQRLAAGDGTSGADQHDTNLNPCSHCGGRGDEPDTGGQVQAEALR